MANTGTSRRDEHCTHPTQTWCDCDWCRYIRRPDTAAAFAMGWHDGKHGLGPDTMRGALEAFGRPIGDRGLGWDFDTCSLYLNGREDGERGDTFRLHGARPGCCATCAPREPEPYCTEEETR